MICGEWMSVWIRNNLFIILLVFALVQCRKAEVLMPEIPVEEFREGDVAFRLGRTLESDAIARMGGSEYDYSHVGVVVTLADTVGVVHIEPMRGDEELIKIESVERFFSAEYAVKGCVVRREDMTEQQRQLISREAKALLQRSVRFDHDYSLSDSTAMYCTELVDFLFRRVGITLTPERYTLPLAREAVILPCSMLRDGDMQQVWRYDLRPARHN